MLDKEKMYMILMWLYSCLAVIFTDSHHLMRFGMAYLSNSNVIGLQ